MKRTLTTLAILLLAATVSHAQQRRIEISPYAGGLFSAGFQSYTQVPLFAGASSGELQPARQPSTGILGLRGSYAVLPKLAVEGSIGYSPLGVDEAPLLNLPVAFGNPDFELTPGGGLPSDPLSILSLSPLASLRIAGKDTITYSGNVVFTPQPGSTWQPYITGGLGVVQRRADYRFTRGPIRTLPTVPGGGTIRPGDPIGGLPGGTPGSTPAICLACSFPLPSPGATNFAVNFGAGVKRYLNDRWGVRLEFRDTISKHRGDTVNNPEATFGLIFRH